MAAPMKLLRKIGSETCCSLQVTKWLASVALWAANRGLLSWVRWPCAKVHYPGAPIPPVLALAHCFVRPGSSRYATAFCAASRAKGVDPIAIALQSVAAHDRGERAAFLGAGAGHGADDIDGGTSHADNIITAVEKIHSGLKVRRPTFAAEDVVVVTCACAMPLILRTVRMH